MSNETLRSIRPCGRLETYSTARHHLGFYNNVGLTATYTASFTMESSLKDWVFTALHQVLARHPNLFTIPVNEDRSYPDVCFERLPEIDLRTCVEFHTRKTKSEQGNDADEELDELLHEQHNCNFTSNGKSKPYWRLIISSSPATQKTFSAAWIFHHALSDGASSMLFHQSFLQGLNASTDLANTSPKIRAPLGTIQPPLEELLPTTLSWSYFLRAVAGSLLPHFARRPPYLWTGSSIDPGVETPPPAHTTTVFFSAETSMKLAARCRAERTSVTAALSALLAAVLSFSVASGRDLKINIPISLRPFVSIPNHQMVNAITNHTHTFAATPTLDCVPDYNALHHFSWATARQVKAALVSEVAKRGVDNPIALLQYVSNMHEFFAQKLGGRRESSAEVSNLGVWRASADSTNTASLRGIEARDVDGKREIKWRIGRMVFSQSSNRTGPPISLSAVTGPDGCLALNFTWSEDNAGLQRLPNDMKTAIERLVV